MKVSNAPIRVNAKFSEIATRSSSCICLWLLLIRTLLHIERQFKSSKMQENSAPSIFINFSVSPSQLPNSPHSPTDKSL